MHHRPRLPLAIVTAALLSLAAGAVAAGNYADVGFTDGMDAPPTAGEEREIGFLTFTAAGDWQLRVTHSELETPPSVAVSVEEAALAAPAALLPMAAIGAAAIVLLVAAAAMARRVSPSPIPSADPTVR
jgi:hypothetical protein